MIGKEQVLAVIPARGGSKGVPGKNIRLIGNKPLIAWSIEAAKTSRLIDRVILSSDDLEIMNVARSFGCEVPFVRDASLAQDDTPTVDVVLDAVERCPGFDWIVLLQPTSPLRTAEDIDNAIEFCVQHNASACVSVSLSQESPYWMFTLEKGSKLQPLMPDSMLTRRQDLPPTYSLNGAVYVAHTEWFKQHKKFISPSTVAYEMPTQRSMDLDTESDFQQLMYFLENQ